jgi:hypothetical protein
MTMFKLFGRVVLSDKEYSAMLHKQTRYGLRANRLSLAALDFIRKVESGRAHSRDSYRKFKEALGK